MVIVIDIGSLKSIYLDKNLLINSGIMTKKPPKPIINFQIIIFIYIKHQLYNLCCIKMY